MSSTKWDYMGLHQIVKIARGDVNINMPYPSSCLLPLPSPSTVNIIVLIGRDAANRLYTLDLFFAWLFRSSVNYYFLRLFIAEKNV